MVLGLTRTITASLIVALGVGLAGGARLRAEEHVVSAADIRQELSSAAKLRQTHLARIQKLLSSEPAQKALKAAKIDPRQVQTAVAYLSDQELARLSAQAEKADFAAGALTNEQLTYIAIALAAAVIVLIIVKA